MSDVSDQWFREVDQKYLRTKHGSPLWIVNADRLVQNLLSFTQFTGSASRILYPVKSNPAPAVLEVLARNGCGADCSNLNEINLALLCGFSWESIAYNSPYQDEKTCKIVLENGGILVLDDPEVIRFVNGLNRKYPGKVWLRINPSTRASYLGEVAHAELMSHGHDSSKFGIPEEDLLEILQGVQFDVSGLHLHVGTQMNNLQAFTTALEALHRVAELLLALNHPVTAIDIGGGLGIAFSQSDRYPGIEAWAQQLNTNRKSAYKYYAEPGHALVGDAVALMVSVKTIKNSRGRRWAVCDAGTDQLAKITLLHWPHQIWHEKGFFLEQQGADALAGPLCFAGDTLLENTNLEAVQVNDSLLVTKAGAYTFSLSNSFNGRSVPAWVLMESQTYLLKSFAEKPYAREFLQHHLWMHTNDSKRVALDGQLTEALMSSYLKSGIQQDEFTICSMTRINSNCYEAELEVSSEAGFVSMPTAIRAIGSVCIVAILHKMGLSTKDRPVIGKKLEIEYEGSFETGKTEIRLHLSEEIKKQGERRSLLIAFETMKQACKGTFVVNI